MSTHPAVTGSWSPADADAAGAAGAAGSVVRPGAGAAAGPIGGAVVSVPSDDRAEAGSWPVGARAAAPASGRRARLAVLASGNGSNLQAVLDACRSGRLAADVAIVVSDRRGAFALERAASAGVSTLALPLGPGEARPDYDARLAAAVGEVAPDWIVLAGWMRILTMRFLGAFPNRVVNLHPALPGEFAGVRAIERAWQAGIDDGLARTGVMVHLVPDEQVDAGPVVATVEVPIVPGESLEALTERVHAAEHDLLVEALVGLCPSPPEPPR